MLDILKLSQIRLYLNNPRLSKSEDEQEALNKIVDDQKKKLLLLAKDIAKHGLSEIDVIAVFPDTDEGYYRVAEGNRRISALKLMQNPQLIAANFPSLSKEFSEIEGRDLLDFDHINVSIFPSENDEELIHFLELRHLGELNGVGTVRWDAKQKGRFDYRVYGKENLIIFLDDLVNRGILSIDQINSVTKTNWERILRPVGLEFFQLDKIDGTYKVRPGCEEEFANKMRLVADSLKGQSVAIVYGQRQIEDFFARMNRLFYGDQSDSESVSENNTKGTSTEDSKPENNSKNTAKSSGEHNGDSHDDNERSRSDNDNSRRMPKDPFKNCSSVIPPSIRMQSRNHRITKIIQELKELNVENYPNACGCLLRALIELCAKEYLEHNNHPRVKNGDATEIEFRDAIILAAETMVQKDVLSVEERRAIKFETEKGGVRQLFNGYMHNTDSYPSAIVIKGIFQTYYKFLNECLF